MVETAAGVYCFTQARVHGLIRVLSEAPQVKPTQIVHGFPHNRVPFLGGPLVVGNYQMREALPETSCSGFET